MDLYPAMDLMVHAHQITCSRLSDRKLQKNWCGTHCFQRSEASPKQICLKMISLPIKAVTFLHCGQWAEVTALILA